MRAATFLWRLCTARLHPPCPTWQGSPCPHRSVCGWATSATVTTSVLTRSRRRAATCWSFSKRPPARLCTALRSGSRSCQGRYTHPHAASRLRSPRRRPRRPPRRSPRRSSRRESRRASTWRFLTSSATRCRTRPHAACVCASRRPRRRRNCAPSRFALTRPRRPTHDSRGLHSRAVPERGAAAAASPTAAAAASQRLHSGLTAASQRTGWYR